MARVPPRVARCAEPRGEKLILSLLGGTPTARVGPGGLAATCERRASCFRVLPVACRESMSKFRECACNVGLSVYAYDDGVRHLEVPAAALGA